jgi:hypothetical protein
MDSLNDSLGVFLPNNLLLYLDGMLITATSMFEVERLKSLLGDEFETKNLGGAKKILGLVSTPYNAHFRRLVALAPQSEEEERSMLHVPYSSAVGSIMCAMVCTR